MATLGRRRSRTEYAIKSLVALVLLGLVVETLNRRAEPKGNPIKSAVVFFASPFMKLGAASHEGMESVWMGVFGAQNLEEENARLREELAEARLGNARDQSREALDWLTQEVSTNIPRGTFDLISVPVLALPPAGARQIMWIDAGSEDNLQSGMIVLGAHGIVGEVTEVYPTTALVELVTDEKAVWGAEVQDRGETGLLRGTGDPLFVELHFDRTAPEAQAADVIVSSGMAGSIAPGGVPFGKIQEVTTNKKGEPVAIIRLPEDPSRLRTVFVLPHRRLPFSPEKQQ